MSRSNIIFTILALCVLTILMVFIITESDRNHKNSLQLTKERYEQHASLMSCDSLIRKFHNIGAIKGDSFSEVERKVVWKEILDNGCYKKFHDEIPRNQ